jgi:hypothetical protein
MKRPRRPRVDSIEQTIKLIGDAVKGPPEPPLHARLRAGDRPFWDDVIRQRARDDWTEVDLVVAVQLARTQADIETQSELLEGEGPIGRGGQGQDVVNPRLSVVELLCKREMAFLRTLRIGGLGNAANATERRRLERQAEGIAKEAQDVEEDRLLA